MLPSPSMLLQLLVMLALILCSGFYLIYVSGSLNEIVRVVLGCAHAEILAV